MSATKSPIEVRRDQERRERRAARSRLQRASTIRRLAAVWLVGVAGMTVVALQERVPVEDLLLDPTVVGGGRWYGGMVTSLIVMTWTVAAVASFAAGYVSRLVDRRGAASTMIVSGAIVTMLMLDDLFLLHSNLVPNLTGLPKLTLVGVEAFAVGAWLLFCKSEVVRTRWELLVAAGMGFGGSLIADQVLDGATTALLVEDGSKLLGVLALAAWSISTATDLARSAIRS